jgi:hypothetical protein
MSGKTDPNLELTWDNSPGVEEQERTLVLDERWQGPPEVDVRPIPIVDMGAYAASAIGLFVATILIAMIFVARSWAITAPVNTPSLVTISTVTPKVSVYTGTPATLTMAAPKRITKQSVVTNKTGWKVSLCSWYGPGFYGRRTANGTVLKRNSLNVAVHPHHFRRLKGKRIQFRYRGRVVVAVVNDTGGFARYGREFDLGPGTAKALGFSGVGRVYWRLLN